MTAADVTGTTALAWINLAEGVCEQRKARLLAAVRTAIADALDTPVGSVDVLIDELPAERPAADAGR